MAVAIIARQILYSDNCY